MNPGCGGSSVVSDETLNSLVESNQQQIIRELAKISKASQVAICRHFEKMVNVSSLNVWVPWSFSEKKKADV